MTDLIPDIHAVTQILVVVAAFSVLIFVHELGHYLAARLTGVRVERFFVGFDIFGLALKKEYKGTVYGIGVLPLGGYCALAGQNDDPRKEVQTGAKDELQNKPLRARALVFAGGVIMNFIFGFFVLIAAYMYGIPFIPPVLGQLDPTGPAAVYGFKSGDRILEVDGRAIGSFEDAAEAIALAGAGGEMEVAFERRDDAGQMRTLAIRVKGRGSSMRGNLNTIGVDPERSRVVGGVVDDPLFADAYAGRLGVGDEILAVDGVDIPVNRGELIQEALADRPGQTANLTVKAPDGSVRDVAVPLETYGDWDMGLRIAVGIGSVTPDGPADKAGLRTGDLVVAYQLPGQPQPQRFSSTREFMDMVGDAALKTVAVNINRNGDALAFTVKPAVGPATPEYDPETDTLLGVQGRMEGDKGFLIEGVLADTPLDGLAKPGDYLTGFGGKPLPKGLSLREAVEEAASDTVRLFVSRDAGAGDGETRQAPRRDVPDSNVSLRLSPRINIEYRRPMIGVELLPGPVTAVEPGSFAEAHLGGAKRLAGARLAMLQYSPDLASTTLRFLFPEDSPYGGGMKTFVLETPGNIRSDPLAAGLSSRLPVSLKTAEEVHPLSFLPAVAAAGRKWVDLSLMVYKVLHKLVVRTLPLDAVGGPVQLFRIIKIADDRGFAYFLYIVALISVNLGVCNLLPFPVLDGGHLLFLLIEWLMGRPPPPVVKETAQWIGLVCLLALMLTVTGYDVLHLVRGTG
ncbi:MAG: site-2 protease family protein [Planctomycetota bacterium]|jgi:regulator of sigma E protease|nr:site-2 protease family protein [Planctomycetota bacterium]